MNAPEMQVVSRVVHIPIVESGWKKAESMYSRLKKSNSLLEWTLDSAESSVNLALDTAIPFLYLFNDQINAVDKVLCKSLDLVEERVPAITLPPQMIYAHTKDFVRNSRIVRPVLTRADSFKQIGNSVLSSKYTEYAADKLDNALNVADKYVDKYLPEEQNADERDSKSDADQASEPAQKAVQTMHHVDRFSRKLQRRLTRRTLAEAKALKEQSKEAIHVLVYVADLIVKDPRLAWQKAKELWSALSLPEPENQARPKNLEQLLVMVTRETARRLVHLVNGARAAAIKFPGDVRRSLRATARRLHQMLDRMIKTANLEGPKDAAVARARMRAIKISSIMKQINNFISDFLERVALSLAGQTTADINNGNIRCVRVNYDRNNVKKLPENPPQPQLQPQPQPQPQPQQQQLQPPKPQQQPQQQQQQPQQQQQKQQQQQQQQQQQPQQQQQQVVANGVDC